MTKNPIINALAGLLYIVLIASAIFNAEMLFGTQENTILIPIAMLSLFVFSASIMSYLFLYQPLQMFLDGEKKASVNLFLQTLAAFAVSAAVLVVVGLYLTPFFK